MIERPAGRIEVVRSADRTMPPGGQTPGMVREQAFATERLWTGVAFTEPGMVSGWHHHGEHHTYFCVVSGKALLETGPDEHDKIEAKPGDFIHVPPWVVHRESNPSAETSMLVVFRTGTGEVVVDAEAPSR